MSASVLLEKIKSQKIGKTPVVILPLKVWQIIADQLEELEMLNSKILRKKIAKARLEKKFYTPSQVRKMLGF